MRLINADKLYPDTFGKGRLAVSQSQIADAPTVQAVPIEVLDKIRADIDAHREKLKIMADDDWYAGKIRGYDCAIEIIDKYRGSEVQSDTK